MKLLIVLANLVLLSWLIIAGMVIAFLWAEKPTIETTLRDFHTMILEYGLTGANFRKATLEWEQASKSQAVATSTAMSNVNAAVSQFSSFISRTDNSVNSQLLPSLVKSINQQNDALLENQKALQANLSGIAQATTDLEKTLVDADRALTDPAIHETLVHVEEIALATAGTANHIEASTKDLEDYVHRFTRPASQIKTFLLFLLDNGFKVRSVLGY